MIKERIDLLIILMMAINMILCIQAFRKSK